MNYSEKSNQCRVDFFKESGKWYATECVTFSEELYNSSGIESFKTALETHLGKRMRGLTAVCLEPYCEHSYPVMYRIPD